MKDLNYSPECDHKKKPGSNPATITKPFLNPLLSTLASVV
jgi:hypothetical protein